MFRFRAEGEIKNLVLGTPDRRSAAWRQKNVPDHDRIIGDVRHQVADTKIQEMRSSPQSLLAAGLGGERDRIRLRSHSSSTK